MNQEETYQPSYTRAFARVYDVVMRDVNYPAWSAHILNLCEAYDLPCETVLHLACGTGSLDGLLAGHGLRITGVDQSEAMIEEARDKARIGGYRVEYLVAPMQSVSLDRQFDLVLCLYDSLNYITAPEQVQEAFRCAFEHTRPGGAYIFDVTTEHNIIHNFANYTFAEDFPDFAYIWENDYVLKSKTCRSRLTIFLREGDAGQYRKYVEDHVQCIYPTRTLQSWLKEAGFRLCGIHDGLTMDTPNSRSERIHFVCRRPSE